MSKPRSAGASKPRNDPARAFESEQEIAINAPRDRVFDALINDVSHWWAYRFHENSTVRLEPWPGGRFYEDSGANDGALWGTVTYVKRPEIIRLHGCLGMLDRPVVSVYSYELVDANGSTVLKLRHRCIGDLDPKWAKAHGDGWGELLGKFLKAWVEERKPYTAFESKLF